MTGAPSAPQVACRPLSTHPTNVLDLASGRPHGPANRLAAPKIGATLLRRPLANSQEVPLRRIGFAEREDTRTCLQPTGHHLMRQCLILLADARQGCFSRLQWSSSAGSLGCHEPMGPGPLRLSAVGLNQRIDRKIVFLGEPSSCLLASKARVRWRAKLDCCR